MTSNIYKGNGSRHFEPLFFAKLVNITSRWGREFLSVKGSCHDQYISFDAIIYSDGIIDLKCKIVYNGIKDENNAVRLYKKDNSLYLFFMDKNRPFTGVVQCSRPYIIVDGFPDDTYTEIPIK